MVGGPDPFRSQNPMDGLRAVVLAAEEVFRPDLSFPHPDGAVGRLALSPMMNDDRAFNETDLPTRLPDAKTEVLLFAVEKKGLVKALEFHDQLRWSDHRRPEDPGNPAGEAAEFSPALLLPGVAVVNGLFMGTVGVDDPGACQAHPRVRIHKGNGPVKGVWSDLCIRVEEEEITSPAEGKRLVVGGGEAPVFQIGDEADGGETGLDNPGAAVG